MLDGTRPPPLWRRVGVYIMVPSLLIASMNHFAVEVPMNESDKTDDIFGEDSAPRKVAPLPLVLCFWAYIVVLVVYTRFQRQSIRKEIMTKLYEERSSIRGEDVDSIQLRLFLDKYKGDISVAHRSCCCYPEDDVFFDDNGVASSMNRLNHIDEVEGDCCTSLWRCLANTFWASCCGCWCQCCSICAVWQEEMEVNRLTGNDEHTMDYVTFQVRLPDR